MRKLNGVARLLFLGSSMIVILLVTYVSFFPQGLYDIAKTNLGYFAYIFALLMPFVFLLHPASARASKERIAWYDILLAIVAFICFALVGFFALDAQTAGWATRSPVQAIVLGLIAWGLVVEAARRCGGTGFATIIFLFSLLPLLGPSLPAPFTTPRFGPDQIASLYLFHEDAIFGSSTKALIKLVVGYFIFGAVMQGLGGGDYLIKVVLIPLGGLRGATAKVAVIGSCIFGMFSGSAISNVITTGTVTIPAMKKSGYKPYYAGAVETTASTGGIIMPPVMGGVAFIMSEFTQIPYPTIAMAAALPALLYYFAVFVQSDLQAAKLNIAAVPKEERGHFTPKLAVEGLDYFISLVVLIYVIFVQYSAEQAPFWALVPLLVGGVLKKQITLHTIPNIISEIGALLSDMSAVFAALGLMVGALLVPGFGLSVASVIYSLAGSNLMLLLFLGAALAIFMGCGVSATAVYILLGLTLGPALVKLGLSLLAVHLFLVYYSTVAAITPPVGPASLAASRIAGAPYFQTGFQGMRLGVVMLLVPFYFVANPSLVLQGSPLETAVSFGVAVFAVLIMAFGFERRAYVVGEIGRLEAAAAIASGLAIILPIASWLTQTGWVLASALVLCWVIRFVVTKKRAASLQRISVDGTR